jgi:hypothetical protein
MVDSRRKSRPHLQSKRMRRVQAVGMSGSCPVPAQQLRYCLIDGHSGSAVLAKTDTQSPVKQRNRRLEIGCEACLWRMVILSHDSSRFPSCYDSAMRNLSMGNSPSVQLSNAPCILLVESSASPFERMITTHLTGAKSGLGTC